jgi:hypothetical protein
MTGTLFLLPIRLIELDEPIYNPKFLGKVFDKIS